MRVSTGMMFEVSTRSMLESQATLLRTQQQMSTGKRMLAASDDPVAASLALAVRADAGLSAQHSANQAAARAALELAEVRLGAAGELLANARTLVVAAGNGVLATSDRQSIASELRGLYTELLGMANTRDGQGRYLFAGFQEGVQPFTETATGAVYNGDQGERALPVSGSRLMAVSADGHAIFEQGRSGNGVFKTTLGAANAGNMAVGIGNVYDPTLLTGNAYRVVLNVAAGATTYDVFDLTAGSTLSSGNAYVAGTAIRFAGIEIPVEGAPAAGDRIEVAPSTSQSLFKSLADAIDAVSTGSSAALRTSRLGVALAELDSGSERILAVRAEFGSHLRELEDLGSLGEHERTLLEGQRSRLEDVDYARAASDFQRQQLALQAAQQTYVRMASLSLFNFIG